MGKKKVVPSAKTVKGRGRGMGVTNTKKTVPKTAGADEKVSKEYAKSALISDGKVNEREKNRSAQEKTNLAKKTLEMLPYEREGLQDMYEKAGMNESARIVQEVRNAADEQERQRLLDARDREITAAYGKVGNDFLYKEAEKLQKQLEGLRPSNYEERVKANEIKNRIEKIHTVAEYRKQKKSERVAESRAKNLAGAVYGLYGKDFTWADAERRIAKNNERLKNKNLDESERRYLEAENKALNKNSRELKSNFYSNIPARKEFNETKSVDRTPTGFLEYNKKADFSYGFVNDLNVSDGRRVRDLAMSGVKGNSAWVKALGELTTEEKDIYNYLCNTEGRESGLDYLYYLEPELNKRVQYEKDLKIQRDIEKSNAKAALYSAGTVAAAPVRAIAGLGAAVEDTVKVLSGEEIDPYSAAHSWGNATGTIRGNTKNKIPGFWGKLVYDVSMSVGDNVANSLAFGGIAKAAGSAVGMSADGVRKLTGNIVSAAMSADSTANAIVYNKQRGLSDERALALAFAQGLVEFGTEKMAIDEILKAPKSSLGRAMVVGGISEGTEELTSGAVNMALDFIMTGSDSDIVKLKDEYVKKGYGESFALMFAIAESLGEQTLAGIVSGAAMSGGFRALGFDGDASEETEADDILYQIEDEDGKILNTDDKSGKIEIERKSAIETKIKYSPNGLKLPAGERERLFSRIGTDYYHTNKTHEGLQYQSVVTDSEHLLYVYQDGGFGHYNVLARVDYQNEFAAKRITEEIDNGRIYEISKVIDRVLESPEIRQSGYNVYNALTKKRRRTVGDASLYSRQSEGNTGRVNAGGNGDSRSGRGNGDRNVSDFDKVIAMGDNDAAEIARKNIADVKTDGQDVLYQIEDEDGKTLNTDDKSGKIKGDGSQFRVMWTIEDGTLTEQDVALVYREIEKINNRGIDNYDMSADGEYILDINNKLIYTDADHKFPEISKVISFDSEYEDEIVFAKEVFLDAEKDQSSLEYAAAIVESFKGQGFVITRNFEDSGAYARLQDRRRKGTFGTEIDSRSGKNVDDFDKVIAMGDNDAAEIARNKIQDAENQDDVLNGIESVGSVGKSGITYDDMMSGNITEEVRAQKENFEGAVGRAGFKVIYATDRNVPKGTIGYVDFSNREIYISPEHFSESLLNHELTHVIDRGYDGKYVKNLISFFKEEMSKDWNDAEQAIRDKYEKIAEENPGFAYSERTIQAETLAEMCEKFSTDKYIKNAANMKTGTIRQIAVMFRYMWSKMLYHFGDNSEARKMKIASMKWQMALYRAVNEGEANGGDASFYGLVGWRKDGIEVYETSAETKAMPYKERRKAFVELMENEYRGRTARFVKDGKKYYAMFDADDVRENIYGDKHSDDKGRDAKLNTGADGAIFDLVENSKYVKSEVEKGKDTRAHKGVIDWDYYEKTVQIDDVVYDVYVNVRNKTDDSFVYSIHLRENKKIKAASPHRSVKKSSMKSGDSHLYGSIISQTSEKYNKNVSTDDDMFFSVADDEVSAGQDSGSNVRDASALEEEIGIIDEALEDKSLSRDDRLALIKDRVRLKRELSEVAGEKKEDKPSRREKVLEEYRETEDVGVLPDRNEILAAESYDKKKISEYRKEFAEIQEALRNQEDLSADDVEELKMRRDAVVTALNRLSENNSVLSEIEGILDELGVVEEPDHRWVSDIAEELSDKQNIIKYGTYNQNDIERNFRHFFGKHFKKAYDKVIQPLYDSKKRYVEGVNEYAEKLKADVVDELGIKKGTRESAAVMWLGEGKRPLSKRELAKTYGKEGAKKKIAEAKAEGQSEVFIDYTYEDCKKDFGEETAQNIQKATEVFRKMYDELIADVNKTRSQLYPNNPDKLVKKRKDYFHHFQEMSKGFEGLRNILNTNIGIDPMLVGTSEHTKPKSKWQAYMQERVGNRTVYDAVEGFIRYLPSAQYSIHIDPNIVNVRGLARELALAKASEYSEHGNPDANGFIAYLQKYANSLAGKTVSHFDRAINDSNFGRTATALVGWLNNKTKASAVLGNINSVLSQVTNMKNVIGKIENQADFIKGAIDALGGLNPDGKISARYKESGFLGERYFDRTFSQFDTKWQKMNPVKWAADVLGFADEIGTRITWNAGYNEAVRKGVENPVQYADNFTRASVAGRGIGEEALVFKSQIAKMFLPFRTEVLNDLRVQQDILFGQEYDIWEKSYKKITPDMSEKQRYEALKNRVMKVAQAKELVTENVTEEDVKRLETEYKSEAKVILEKLRDDFGVTKDYTSEDIELDFNFSKRSFGESVTKQKKNYTAFAKMMSCFDEVVENAVGIEVHKDKYVGTTREDSTLEQSYVLASAFSDDDNIHPVKLLVKEFNDGKKNKLYVAIVPNKKEGTISIRTLHQDDATFRTPVPSVISLSQLLNIVNDEDFDKYIPKQFKGDKKFDDFDRIIAMGSEADGKRIKTGVGKRVKNIMQLYVASMVINAVIAAVKGDEFDPIEEAEEGFGEGGIFGALESVLRDYADGTGDPVAFDPIYDIVTGIYQGVNEGESAGGKVGKVMQRTVQNIAGDYVSNNPFSSAAMGIVGIDSDASDMIFNGKVYSPGGMGMPLASNLSTVFRELSQGDEGSAVAAAVKPFLPLGTQIDRSAKGLYDYHKGYATSESVYERIAGEDGDLKYLIEKTPGNFAKSLLFGPGAFSGESDAFYNDKTRKFSEKEQAEILSKSDYDSRKVTFDEILAGRVYNSEEEERKTLVAEEFFRDNEDSILYEIYSSGEDAALPYRNMGVSSSFTDSKTKKKYTLKLSAKEAEKITDEMCTVIAKRFDRANESDVFSTMTREEQVKYLDGVKNAEYEFAKISALHDKGKMSDEDFFRVESNYKKCEAERDRALYVDDVSLYVEYNVADTVGQYASYTDVPISEEGYEQLRAWSEYASTREPDDVDKELMRLSVATDSSINVSGNPYGIINYTKNKVEYKISMPDNKIYALCDEVDKAVRSGLSKLFATTAYLNATAEVQKDLVASVKRKVRDDIKDKYKVKYKSVKIDDFDKVINMGK